MKIRRIDNLLPAQLGAAAHPWNFTRDTPYPLINYNPLLKRGVVAYVKSTFGNVSLPRTAFALTTLVLMLSRRVFSGQKTSADTAVSVQSFLGRWDLTLKTPLREYPSWVEITQEEGQPRARMVSRWGHARPLPKIEISNG